VNIFARWRRHPALVGVDIGPDAVRLLQLSRADAGVQISHHACEPLPQGAVVDGQVADIEAVGAAIARARERSGAQARSAAVALPAPAAVLRLVTVPAGLDEAEMEARLELEAARIAPNANGPLYLDFEALAPLPDDPDRVQVLLAIARGTPVNRCIAALKRGGLRTAAVDVEALALARALTVLSAQPLAPEQVLALNRHNTDWLEADTSLWAQTKPPDGITPLLLACGLALREISA